ncbi:MAG: hypothetical protein MZV49_02710 [Rhodopseudomonas palustris]|nr:hypothetical protein [Rhodopseudomonas palustris]
MDGRTSARAGGVDAGRRAPVGRPAAAAWPRARCELGIPAMALFPVIDAEAEDAGRPRGHQPGRPGAARGARAEEALPGARRDAPTSRSTRSPRHGQDGLIDDERLRAERRDRRRCWCSRRWSQAAGRRRRRRAVAT